MRLGGGSKSRAIHRDWFLALHGEVVSPKSHLFAIKFHCSCSLVLALQGACIMREIIYYGPRLIRQLIDIRGPNTSSPITQTIQNVLRMRPSLIEPDLLVAEAQSRKLTFQICLRRLGGGGVNGYRYRAVWKLYCELVVSTSPLMAPCTPVRYSGDFLLLASRFSGVPKTSSSSSELGPMREVRWLLRLYSDLARAVTA
ncbi:uncharacterized protein BDR25DRAFT_352450 [Lindgomyces ingoldianus]|uniref:Uncharacterized protein n=1 Tax=Lindgomyces ingoldianus TaxID=673940 RepID=A0ACB6R408_9PLEO|nr:uncharacterized protein BDR25DRAFT_352450 [Lindgomyces ingoldianus]KAF2473998.1 hypothetical protein BDR25DRAFT_352450 [Lindgomyces ingoldianus]